MLKRIKKSRFTPILFLIIVWIIFAFPYIVQNKVPYPSDYQVNKFIPWSMDEELLGPVKNEAIPDVIGQLYPWRYFTISQWKNLEIPYWNPYSFSGTPHLANYQSAVFSPFNLIFIALPFIDAWSINILLQPIIAGIGMFLFLKNIRLSTVGSLIGSVSFMLCGFIVVWMPYGTLSMAAALLPFTLFSIDKVLDAKKYKYIFLLTISLASSFLAGHFQTSFYVFLFLLTYFIFKSNCHKAEIKNIITVLLGILLALVISSIQFIPTIQYYNQAIRNSLNFTGGGIPLDYLITIFSPDFYGNPVTRNNWYGLYAEWASFVGVIPFILFILSIFSKHKKNISFFMFTTFLFLLFAIDTPFQLVLGSLNLPIISTSIPTRIIFLVSFSISVLAAYGSDAFITLISEKKYKKILIGFLIFIFTISVFIISIMVNNPLSTDKLFIAFKNLILPTLFIGFFLLLSLISIKLKKIRKYILIILLFLTALDSLRFATKWMPFAKREDVFIQTAVITKLQNLNSTSRTLGNYAGYIDTYFNISSTEGYDSLYIKRYGEFIEAAVDGTYHEPQRNTVYLSRNGKYTDRVISLLGIKYFLHVKKDLKKPWAFPVWSDSKKYNKIYEDKIFEIYQITKSVSRAKFYKAYEVLTDSQKLLARFYSEDFDPESTLLLEKAPSFKSTKVNNSISRIDFIKYTANEIILSIDTDRSGMVFLADPYYSNWKVRVNGVEQPIYRANYAFRAVEVLKGKSEVVFYYSFL